MYIKKCLNYNCCVSHAERRTLGMSSENFLDTITRQLFLPLKEQTRLNPLLDSEMANFDVCEDSCWQSGLITAKGII
jgi:hypothetical protein